LQGETAMAKGFIYEWTNTVTGKKYIGSHIGSKDDSYLGSGVDFLKDLKQYGVLNYNQKILEYVDNEEDVSTVEEKWLTSVDAKHNPEYLNKSNHACGSRIIKRNSKSRPICQVCKQRPTAIAYHRNEKVYYRSTCTQCLRKAQHRRVPKMRWQLDGYKKKAVCDRCNFRAKYSAQLQVFHVDGDLNNSSLRNLKTVCQNCVVEISKTDQIWRPGDLEPDF
jgi:hypothetical protein